MDVHCHLTHDAFTACGGVDAAVARACAAGLTRVVVNGLEPTSNRAVLEMCARHPDVLRAALGIYPLDACAKLIDADEFKTRLDRCTLPPVFDIADELGFIDQQAANGSITAVGEAGLDGMYGYAPRLLDAQEEVLRELCRIAKRHSIPIIVHSRAAELRVFEVLQDEGVELADFHCFMGKKKLAMRIAEAGYFLSIPAFVGRNPQVQSYCRDLPLEQLLSETDAPYLAPQRNQWPNEPSYVPGAVAAMASVRNQPVEEIRAQIWANYQNLFGD